MDKVKNELLKSLSKTELLEAFAEMYAMEERLYDENLERMAHLHDQIDALKENNKSIHNRMKRLADKIKEVSSK